MLENVSFVVAVATLTTPVAGFVILRIIEFRRDRRLARRAAVSRVLDSVERANLALVTSSVSGLWTNHLQELTQLLPRLLTDLDRKDEVIAVWVYREIQSIVLQSNRKQTVRAIQQIGFTLTEWHSGKKSRRWFERDLADRPPTRDFRFPRRARWRLRARPVLTMLTLPTLFGFAFGVGFHSSAAVKPAGR
jgi:hypothetical protein